MKWVWIIGGGLVGIVCVVALIGAMLPQKHRASRTAKFRQRPEAIYALLAGPPDWRTDVKASGALPDRDGHKQWWEQDGHGQKMTYELLEDRAPVRRVMRIADRSLPFGGTWTFDIAPEGQGSSVTITENGEIYNVIFRFVARFFMGYTASIDGYLRDMEKRFGA